MDARPRLLDRARDHLRKLHYSARTEQQYLFWIRRFILFHGKRHPSEMAARQVEDFLMHLAVDRKVSASTQNQALAAILFLYQKVMQVELTFALERKYPNAYLEWGWQHVFPAERPSRDPRSGAWRRHHIYPDSVQRHVKTAV